MLPKTTARLKVDRGPFQVVSLTPSAQKSSFQKALQYELSGLLEIPE